MSNNQQPNNNQQNNHGQVNYVLQDVPVVNVPPFVPAPFFAIRFIVPMMPSMPHMHPVQGHGPPMFRPMHVPPPAQPPVAHFPVARLPAAQAPVIHVPAAQAQAAQAVQVSATHGAQAQQAQQELSNQAALVEVAAQEEETEREDQAIAVGGEGPLGTQPTPDVHHNGPLKCPVCHDTFEEIRNQGRRATALRCGHLCCQVCFSDILDSPFPVCPICRTPINRNEALNIFLAS